MKDYKIIVAHSGRQHSFKLASALKKAGHLKYYVTTIYDKESSVLMKVIKRFLDKDNLKRANSRKNADLLDSEVAQFCEVSGLIEILLARYDHSHVIYRWFQQFNANRFGAKVADLAIRSNADAVVMYDANAKQCFRILQKKAPHIKRIMDVSSTARPYKKIIYENEIAHSGHDDLKKDNEYLWNRNRLAVMQQEIDYAQYFLVPSSFVQKGLEHCGVKRDQVKIVPYGANVSSQEEIMEVDEAEKIHFLFVGNVDYNKGITYLLEAMESFDHGEADLTITGGYDKNKWFIQKAQQMSNVELTGRVTFDRMKNIYEHADVFVIDSFSEGLAQVGIEAMACGLPIICSTNSGVNDLVEEEINGFVIEPGNVEVLVSRMKWFVHNRDRIAEMGRSAKSIAQQYTWNRYNEQVIEQLDAIFRT